MSYRLYKFVILFFAFSVIVGGLYADHFPHRDFYPFFSWSLFSNSSNNDTAFFIRVQSFGGQPDDTVIFAGNVSRYLDIDFLPDYYWNIQEAALSVKDGGDDSGLLAVTSKFRKRPVEYELIEATYDAMELKKKGIMKDVKIVKEFKIE